MGLTRRTHPDRRADAQIIAPPAVAGSARAAAVAPPAVASTPPAQAPIDAPRAVAAQPAGRRRALFVTSEMTDFVKAGGLGDVAAALPRALRTGCDMRVLIPGYPAVLRELKAAEPVGRIAARAGLPGCVIVQATLADGLVVLVLVNDALYGRGGSPYVDADGRDWADNAIRFGTLAHAAAEIAAGRAGFDWQPDLLHLNDWPCALAAAYVHWDGGSTPTLLTVHNLAYQGLFPSAAAATLGIPAAAIDSVLLHGQLSLLRAGLEHASHVNTVSERYASEITRAEHGGGLHDLLGRRAQAGTLSGILNGIEASWDPRTDGYLRSHFGLGDWAGKRANARQARRDFGLPDATGPLFAVVSRLVHQKGVDLACAVAPRIAAAGGQLIVIGTGEPALEHAVSDLARRFPVHVGACIGFDESLARRMFAGADFLLMPSRFEPCGLSQMYAQRFGCLPVAHATGGLVDTVDDGVTGFLCGEATEASLEAAVERALRVARRPLLLDAMRRAAMQRPAGWAGAARRYLQVYARIDAARTQRATA